MKVFPNYPKQYQNVFERNKEQKFSQSRLIMNRRPHIVERERERESKNKPPVKGGEISRHTGY